VTPIPPALQLPSEFFRTAMQNSYPHGWHGSEFQHPTSNARDEARRAKRVQYVTETESRRRLDHVR